MLDGVRGITSPSSVSRRRAPKLDITERFSDGAGSGAGIVMSPESWSYAELLRFRRSDASRTTLRSYWGTGRTAKLSSLPMGGCGFRCPGASTSATMTEFTEDDCSSAQELLDSLKRHLNRIGTTVDATPDLKEFRAGSWGANYS